MSPPRPSAIVASALAVLMGSCRDDFDWCTENAIALELGAIETTGTIAFEYTSRRIQTTAIFDRVFVLEGPNDSLRVLGCATDRGDLVRFDGWFSALDPTMSEQPVEPFENDEPVPGSATFGAYTQHCENMSCLHGIHLTYATDDGTGVVHGFDRGAASFSADVTVAFPAGGLDDAREMHAVIDLTWTP